MKKVLWVALGTLGTLVLLTWVATIGFLTFRGAVQQPERQVVQNTVQENRSFGSQDTTRFGAPTHSVVTALTSTPVKVLTRSSGRQYAMIQNNSTAPVFIYLGNFSSGSAASTTVLVNKGIRLGTTTTFDNVYTIKADNLYYGDVWVATTSAANQEILVTEK